jgi:hypothetical protein
MSTHLRMRPWRSLSVALLATLLLFIATAHNAAAQRGGPGAEDAPAVEVRFKADALPNARGQLMSSSLRTSIAHVERLFTIEEGQLRALRARAERKSGRALPVLEAWYRITLRDGIDVDAFLAELRQMDFVDYAEPAPEPQPLPSMPYTFAEMMAEAMDHEPTPLFEALQGYLDPAPGGIDARYAWNFPGGNGAGFTVYDIESDWNLTHEDLSKAHGITPLMSPGDVLVDPNPDTGNHHGTAVLGQLIADPDDKGVTGISWGADVEVAPANTQNLGYNLANAIALSVADGSAGDVILIEQQTRVCGLSADLGCDGPGGYCGPSEWVQSVFDATLTATSAGFIVVAAAGNGDVDLDQEDCDGRFDRSVRDSGAIIVGAGSSTTRNRLNFSSFGSRIDLQGWGHNVMTTGYGLHYTNHDQPDNEDFWYTRTFAGTSSASPIVSGAALNLQGTHFAANGELLTPAEIRTILIETGTAGGTGWGAGNPVPPLPNLRFAIAEIINVPPVADAGPDQTVECECFDGAEITLDGSGSFDDNNDPLTYSWSIGGEEIATGVSPTVTLDLGVHLIMLTVTDPGGLSDTDAVTITVEDTTDPVVTLLGDDPLELECGVDVYEELKAEVTDICDPAPSLVIDASDVDTETVGVYGVLYTGTDASGNSATETRTVNVVDTTPPTITVNSEPTVFWAPNHEYRTLALADLDIEVEDFCDKTLTPDDVVIVKVTSDEPENAQGNGDGNTLDDMVIGESCNTVDLRAERAGSGNGRVYTLHLALMDASGNIGTTTYEVHVPHDQRPGSVAIADDPVYTVEAEACEPVHVETLAEVLPSVVSGDPVAESTPDIPEAFVLAPNHPNPFNPTTTISFTLPEASHVRLSVYNMLGQEVARLVDAVRESGAHQARFDASTLPSGMYVYTIEAGQHRASRTMVLMK